MAEVRWIKIATDMFHHPKIMYLRNLPGGDNIVLIWIMLLTMAGRCNDGGLIYLTVGMPYTSRTLSDELGFKEKVMDNALSVLQDLNMISRENDIISVVGWGEYQNIDGLDEIRKKGRERTARCRERQKNARSNVAGNVTVTPCNTGDIDREIESNKRKTTESGTAERMESAAKGSLPYIIWE